MSHAPKRKDILTTEEKNLALRNALRYFPKKHHPTLAPEFAQELKEFGRIYMYRLRPEHAIRELPIDQYPARCKQAAAIMLMIQNNLDPAGAQHPHELITYGGSGAVLQNWAQYRLVMKYLSEMTEEQTLVMYSGHPLGLFPSHADAPRVVVTIGMVIPNYSKPDDWERMKMDEAFITSPYAENRFTSLASVLSAEGYRTSFYHGGRNGTMGFDGFARAAGYHRYVGMNEYPDGSDYDGAWGIWDRPFLRFFANELDHEPEPFHSTIFTLSSHHPYELPPAEAGTFPSGTHRIHASLRYTDDALREFFSIARTKPWFERTLFVITADHTADIDRTGQNYTEAVDYWVPLLYYMPGTLVPQRADRVTLH